MIHPPFINHIIRFFREIYRHIILALISPRAFYIFVVIRLIQLLGGRYEKIMPYGYTDRRYQKADANRSIGWVEEIRIYRLWLGRFKIHDFPVSNPKTLHILNFYYFRDASFVLKDFNRLIDAGATIDLHQNMRVFEPGCNMGKMLFLFKDLYDARITGADIYAPAIAMVKKIKSPNDDFYTQNTLQSDWFSSLPDNYFDLAIASSFINHVAHLDSYDSFLKNLKRTCRQIYIHDRTLDNPQALDNLRGSGMKTTMLERGRELSLFASKEENS